MLLMGTKLSIKFRLYYVCSSTKIEQRAELFECTAVMKIELIFTRTMTLKHKAIISYDNQTIAHGENNILAYIPLAN